MTQVISAIISGVLLALPFCDGRLWIFAWFGFVPLLFALRGVSPKRAFLFSYITGIVFWAITIYWLVHVTLLGQIILILYLSLYFGAFGFIVSRSKFSFTFHLSPFTFFFIPSLWVLLEYLRAHLLTGFGWAFLGYSQYLNLPIIQIADIAGVYGVSFLLMLTNVAIWEMLLRVKGQGLRVKERKIWLFSFFVLFVFSLGYGCYKLSSFTLYPSPLTLKVSVIQGNIPQELKWAPGMKGVILNRYLELTRGAAIDKPDLIIWPESSNPGFVGEDEGIFREILDYAAFVKTPVLIGTVIKEENDYFNSALLIDAQGEVAGRYDKLHLVPFGEYIPLKKMLPFLEVVVPIGDFTAGKEYTLLGLQRTEVRFAVLICFEDTVSKLSREFVKRGADFLVNITNDGWYKDTSAPYQHLSASVFRAVENRIPLVRAANTGVSCFIDTKGRISGRVAEGNKDTFITGYRSREITLNKSPSIYNFAGDWFVLCCVLGACCGIITKIFTKK